MDKKLKMELGKRIGIWMFSLSLFFLLMTVYVSFTWAAEKTYPNRPVSIIVPFTPGGMTDLQAKLIGDKLSEILGQPFIRVHKPGAGGSLGISFAAGAKPDGYTLCIGTSSTLILPPILKKLDYKMENFIPFIYAKGQFFLAVKADSKWKTLADFIKDATVHPGELKIGSFGKFTTGEFITGNFSKHAGIKLIYIPFKSVAEALTALLGGHIEGVITTTSLGQLEAGAIRILALSDYERSPLLPDVKTFEELGYPVSLPVWYALCAPKNTPNQIVDILSSAMQEVFKRYQREIKEEFRKLECSPSFFDSQESMQKFREDQRILLKIAQELGAIAK